MSAIRNSFFNAHLRGVGLKIIQLPSILGEEWGQIPPILLLITYNGGVGNNKDRILRKQKLPCSISHYALGPTPLSILKG